MMSSPARYRTEKPVSYERRPFEPPSKVSRPPSPRQHQFECEPNAQKYTSPQGVRGRSFYVAKRTKFFMWKMTVLNLPIVVVVVLRNKKPAHAVPLENCCRQHPENQEENQAGHSSERTVEGKFSISQAPSLFFSFFKTFFV